MGGISGVIIARSISTLAIIPHKSMGVGDRNRKYFGNIAISSVRLISFAARFFRFFPPFRMEEESEPPLP